MSGQSAFILQHVTKNYGNVRALVDCTIEIEDQTKVALVGPSGAGKSTLLALLGGVIQPSEGTITIQGKPLGEIRPGPELARLVGMVHQQLDLVPHLSVRNNVLAGCLGRWNLLRSIVSLILPTENVAAQNALRRMGIASKLHERTARLSGGEQQRVAFARVLVQDPKVILADEPVSSLDPARARDLMSLLCETVESSGKTLVASLHSVNFAREFFTRIIGMREGVVMFDAPSGAVDDTMLDQLFRLDVSTP